MKEISWKKLAFPLSAIVILIGALLWFGVISQAQKIILNNEASKEKNEQLTKLQAENDSLEKADKNSAEVESIHEIVSNLWPDTEDVSKFIVQIEDLAQEKGVVLSNIAIAETAPKETKSTAATSTKPSNVTDSTASTAKKASKNSGIRFSFDTAAKYNTTLDLITSLEKLARFNSLNSINLSKGSNDTLTVKISGYIYGK
jgi:hypothetical protein